MPNNREEAFRALVGSHNYNLATESSDEDFKVFIVPTFDDIYYNKMVGRMDVGLDVDVDYHDIRKIPDLWFKSNINFVEVLFSTRISFENSTIVPANQFFLQRNLLDRRDEIARINLPYLYDACFGMYLQKRKSVLKGTASTQVLVDQFGYDTKQALHSIRVLDFLQRYQDSDFNDFAQAIWYPVHDPMRDKLMTLRYGGMTLKQYRDWADEMQARIEKSCKVVYRSMLPDKDLYQFLQDNVKQIVRSELRI